jgi:hypothetical protein
MWANAMCCARLSFVLSSISAMSVKNLFATLTRAYQHPLKLYRYVLYAFWDAKEWEISFKFFLNVQLQKQTYACKQAFDVKMITSVGQV